MLYHCAVVFLVWTFQNNKSLKLCEFDLCVINFHHFNFEMIPFQFWNDSISLKRGHNSQHKITRKLRGSRETKERVNHNTKGLEIFAFAKIFLFSFILILTCISCFHLFGIQLCTWMLVSFIVLYIFFFCSHCVSKRKEKNRRW